MSKQLLATLCSLTIVFANATDAKAAGQAGPIVAEVDADWTHAQSGIVMPAALLDFTRTEISENVADQLDIVISYTAPNSASTLTVYLFRAGLPQAPIWLDRINAAIQTSATTARLGGGVLEPEPTVVAFAPSGQGSAAAMRLVYAMKGGTSKATGAAVIPVNDWLLTIRLTSSKLDKAALDATLGQIAAALPLPAIKQPLPVAVPVTPCSNALDLKAAKRAKPDIADAMFAGLLGSMAMDDASAEKPVEAVPDALATPAAAQNYCRDSSSKPTYGIYRNMDETNGYVMALGDAGVLIDVSPSLSGILSGKNKATFDVRLRMLDRSYNFTPFKSLPTPEQVMQAVNSEKPMSSSDRAGNITITGL